MNSGLFPFVHAKVRDEKFTTVQVEATVSGTSAKVAVDTSSLVNELLEVFTTLATRAK
ncbi:MAG: hypothetical protein KCHDKBKB_01283 [Elusimicrobia bacterium]|nr:hypothetical protein [Elusimicrobiota bacterium]